MNIDHGSCSDVVSRLFAWELLRSGSKPYGGGERQIDTRYWCKIQLERTWALFLLCVSG